jgi:endonuclease VIII
MPEGDTLHRAARSLQVLVGNRLEIEAHHPRARATRVAERLDGHRLQTVQAHGKNLLLRFESGYVLRSHLGMSGSWRVLPRAAAIHGRPWLVLRGETHQAVLRRGSVIELTDRVTRKLGPDILGDPIELDAIVGRLRRCDPGRRLGEALLDQRVVAGIGNLWRAEALWHAGVSPWILLAEATDSQLRSVLGEAARLQRSALGTGRTTRMVYRRTGRPCPRCGGTIRARKQGDDNRTAYWCPRCQVTGKGHPEA